MNNSQCYRCQNIGPQCSCELCGRDRDPNQLCPKCGRAELIPLPEFLVLACDRCSYRATEERHQQLLASIREAAIAREKDPWQVENERRDKDIRYCYHVTTKRQEPGGSDPVGSAKEDKLAACNLIALKYRQRGEDGIVSSETILLNPKDKFVKVTGCPKEFPADLVRVAISLKLRKTLQKALTSS